MSKKRIVFLFPGQGTQKIGMAKDIYDNFSLFRDFFKDVKKWIGVDLENLLFVQNDDINQTQFTQIAILSVELGILRVLRSEGIEPVLLAGYSLGEYAALVASGALCEEDAMRLIKIRGSLMANTVKNGVGGMAAVIGLGVDDIKSVLSHYKSLQIVNYNTPSQVSIAGLKEEVEKCAPELEAAGARRVVILNVSGPFHSKLLAPASEKFLADVEACKFAELKIPYYPNCTGEKKCDNVDLPRLLSSQISSPVLWHQSMVDMFKADDIDAVVEVGPGSTLRGFLRGMLSDNIKCFGTSTSLELTASIGELK